MCLEIRVSPLFLSVTVMKNYTSFEIEHHRILQSLFVLGLTVILLVDGLGVEDQQHGPFSIDDMHSACCIQGTHASIRYITYYIAYVSLNVM